MTHLNLLQSNTLTTSNFSARSAISVFDYLIKNKK